MRCAVISDIHGNRAALDAVLDAIAGLDCDRIVCLGDTVDPLPQSAECLHELRARGIACLRGNHEDYVVAAADRIAPFSEEPNWEPIRNLARHLLPEEIELLRALPFDLTIADPQAGAVYLCHASPRSNRRGWVKGVDAELSKELATVPAPLLVCGHWHLPQTIEWQGKRLITNGSVGIPLRGKFESEFLILEARGSSGWHAEHRTVSYDPEPTLKLYRESGWLEAGGPIARLVEEEIRTARRRIGRFFEWALGRDLSTLENLTAAVDEFLLSQV